MRKVLALLLVVGVGVVFYVQRRDSASEQVKAQMLLIVDEMTLEPIEPVEREGVKPLISQFHQQAFDEAMDISRQHGRKFDAQHYYNAVLDLTVAQLRSDGNASLADKIEQVRQYHSLTVTEH